MRISWRSTTRARASASSTSRGTSTPPRRPRSTTRSPRSSTTCPDARRAQTCAPDTAVIELTSVQFGDDFRVADLIREQAAQRGDVVALRHGDRARTYAELDQRSNRLAQALLAAGIERGARVAHLDRTAPEVGELLLAASKIGAGTVPPHRRAGRARAPTDVV